MQVREQYPELSTATVYTWRDQALASRTDSRIDSRSQSESASRPSPQDSSRSPSPTRSTEVSYLYPDDCPNARAEIRMLKRELWKHATRPGEGSAVAVQAVNAYLRAIAIEYKLPNEIDGMGDELVPEALSDDELRRKAAWG